MGIFEDICKFPGQTGGEECRSYREESDYTHILTPTAYIIPDARKNRLKSISDSLSFLHFSFLPF